MTLVQIREGKHRHSIPCLWLFFMCFGMKNKKGSTKHRTTGRRMRSNGAFDVLVSFSLREALPLYPMRLSTEDVGLKEM